MDLLRALLPLANLAELGEFIAELLLELGDRMVVESSVTIRFTAFGDLMVTFRSLPPLAGDLRQLGVVFVEAFAVKVFATTVGVTGLELAFALLLLYSKDS